MEHSVIGSHIGHLATVLILQKVGSIAGVSVEHIKYFPGRSHHGRSGIDWVPQFPDPERARDRELPVSKPRHLISSDKVDDVVRSKGGCPGAQVGSQDGGVSGREI